MSGSAQGAASSIPPHHILPALLPLSMPIHRRPGLIMTLTHAEVYPSGCALFVSLRANVVTLEEQRFLGQLLTNFTHDVGEFTVAVVRDGHRQVAEYLTVEEGGLFYRINASGGGQLWRMSYWLAPLPTVSCTVTFHSPPLGIELAEIALHPEVLAAAADRTEELWPGPTGEHQAQAVV
jgi:hypothetical protein